MRSTQVTFVLAVLSLDWSLSSQASVQRLLINLNPMRPKTSCDGSANCMEPTHPPSNVSVAEFNVGDLSANHTVCMSETCEKIAKDIQAAMNTTMDPCEDFFEYACGSWDVINQIPDDKASWDIFGMLGDRVQEQIRDIMKDEDPLDNSTARQKTRALYKSCMDLESMDKRGPKPLLDILDNWLGGWPVISRDWDPKKFNWLDVMKTIKRFGFSGLLDWSTGADPDDPTRNILHFSEVGLGLGSRTYYFSNSSQYIRDAYKKLMKNVITILKDPSGALSAADKAQIQQDSDDVYNWEVYIANISRTEEDKRNLTLALNKMTLQELWESCLTPTMTLDHLLGIIQEMMPNSTLKDVVKPDLIVNVGNPDFLTTLHQHLADHANEPRFRRTLANHLGWKIALEYASKSGKKLRDAIETYSREISGATKEPERWKTCANRVNSVMNTAVGSAYVKRHFEESSKIRIKSMIKDLRNSFAGLLQKADWMDEPTRSKAFTKLNAMLEYVGYADYTVNDVPRLDTEYESLKVGTDYFENCMNIGSFAVEVSMRELLKKNNRSIDESLAPADVNAFYDSSINLIAFVAGILQNPFYNPDRPEYLNYAMIGAVMGHEITHGFDDQGSQFDEIGKFGDWWSAESRSRYQEKARGLRDKYSNYALPEGKVNGYLTLGENIADNGGVKEALAAYQQFVKRRGALEPLLPGFENFTTEQMFFLGYAQIWCGKSRPKILASSLLTGSHSPRAFRVIGPLSGMPEFAESFNCPIGSPMNPAEKAAVW